MHHNSSIGLVINYPVINILREMKAINIIQLVHVYLSAQRRLETLRS